MKLLCSAPSPYSRLVRIMLRYLQLPVEEVTTNPFDNGEELLSANPLGQIPCLYLNDGTTLYDSEVICRYLDSSHGDGQLFHEGDWQAQCRFSLVKGLIDSAVKLRQEQMRQEEGVRSLFWTDRFEQALLRGVAALEHQGIGDNLDARAMAIVCLLDYLEFRHTALPWRAQAPTLARWFDDMGARPIFSETRPG